MSSSIIRNHYTNSIITNLNDNIFVYNSDYKWYKSDKKLYKYIHSDTSDINNILTNINDGDYISTYIKVKNYIKLSESFLTDIGQTNYWNKTGLTINTSETMPITGLKYQAPQFVSSTNNTECSISQNQTIGDKKEITFSAFIRKSEKTPNLKIAIGLFSNEINYGVYIKTDFSKSDIELTPFYLTNTYNKIENTDDTFVGYIQKIELTNNQEAYRLFLKGHFSSDINNIQAKLHILTNDGDFVFSELENNYAYISGFQLEFDYLPRQIPQPMNSFIKNSEIILNSYVYNNTIIPIEKTIFYSLLIYDSTKDIYDCITNNSLNYVTNIIEENINDKIYIKEMNPIIINPKINDICVLSNNINFYHLNNNQNNCVVKFGGNHKIDDPLYSIYYDNNSKVYKIKINEIINENNEKSPVYDNLSVNYSDNLNSYNKSMKNILHAILFSQKLF